MRTLEPRQILAALRTGWWLALAGLILGGAAAGVLTLLQTPLYASSTQFFVDIEGSNAQQVQAGQLAEQRAGAYSRLVTSEDVAARVVDRLDLDSSAAQVRREITAQASGVLVDVTVTDPSARQAQQIAQALGEDFPAYVTEVETRGGGTTPVRVTVSDQPDLPSSAISPDPVRNVAIGSLMGLLAGAGLAVLRVRLRRSVRRDEEVSGPLGAPVVGHVLRDGELATHHVADAETSARAVEDFGRVRRNLQWLNVDNPPTVIQVSSTRPGDGRTTVVLNLALSLAAAGRRVVVVEADLEKPSVTEYLGMTAERGLTDVLAGAESIGDVVQRSADRDVWVLPAGSKPPNPGELLGTAQMKALLEKLRGEFDYVLVDSPALLAAPDAAGLAAHVDGVLLVVRDGRLRPDHLRRAAEVFDGLHARTLGAIVTFIPPKSPLARTGG